MSERSRVRGLLCKTERSGKPKEARKNSLMDSRVSCTGQKAPRPLSGMGLPCLRTYGKVHMISALWEGERPELRTIREVNGAI